MVKDIHSLIRLHDWEVDEKRRALGELLGAVAALEARARKLEEDLVAEQKAARETPSEAGMYYGNYAEVCIQRRAEFVQAIAEVEKQILEAQEILAEAYRELKKYEVVQANRDAAELAELARREQMWLDELGIQKFFKDKGAQNEA
ncbi:MAG: flagellar FliJ family protein [Rhodospirillales bacterium]|nr:flagellar FliJ family protein [Rhodospirillales bacterium]